MQILPLRFVHDIDKKSIGVNLFNLAKLRHLGMPVIEAAIVLPPAEDFQKILNKYLRYNPNLAENLNNIKSDIAKLKMPEVLKEINVEYQSNPKNRLNVNFDTLWINLLEKWIFEISSKIERGEKNITHFTPQQIVFSSNFASLGSAHFDEERGHVVVTVDSGKVDFGHSEKIENLVINGNKKLILPQIYYWVLEENDIKIIKVAPYTQSLPHKLENEEKPILRPRQLPKTATKLFLDYKSDVVNELNSDGVFLRIEKPDVDEINSRIENILKIKNSEFIFFPDFKNVFYENTEFAKSFVFFKNKKRLNCSIVLPQTFSKEEFLEQKRQFAALGIYSKGQIKIWKQFLTIADFLSLEDYLDAGFDGAVIDIDKIINIVAGVEPENFLASPRKDWISSVEKFFKDNGFSKIIKSGKPVLILGSGTRSEELLNYFIKSGVWGFVFASNVLNPMREHISFIEKLNVKKLS